MSEKEKPILTLSRDETVRLVLGILTATGNLKGQAFEVRMDESGLEVFEGKEDWERIEQPVIKYREFREFRDPNDGLFMDV